QLIRTIAASCVNLKFFSFYTGKNSVATSLQHLVNGPFLRGLNIMDGTVTVTDMLEFLRHRGRDLEHLTFNIAPNSPLAPLKEFLPN
ncbi:hypothetical protein HK104_002763, partial [Borealophlyctis nickersoniae]